MFLENAKASGSIEVICGSMFSGKTEELIRRIRRAQFANQKIAIFKPCIDTRYSDEDVVSHDLKHIPSFPVDSPEKILEHIEGIEVVDFKDLEILEGEELVWRKADLRAFVVTGKETKVWKSGLTRFSRNPDSFVVNSSQGGGFKDTWVMKVEN